MAAPTNTAKREESSCQLGAVHTWPNSAELIIAGNVRFLRLTGSAWRVVENDADDPLMRSSSSSSLSQNLLETNCYNASGPLKF